MTNKFSKKVFASAGGTGVQKEESNIPKRFKMCYVDHDTVLFRCAKFMQDDYIEVTHTASGNVKEFKNTTSFGVRAGKIIDVDAEKDLREKEENPVKWLGWLNLDRAKKGLEPFKVEDFTIEAKSRLTNQCDTYEEALEKSMETMDYTIGAIKRFMDAEDYTLCIGAGEGNYRDFECKDVIYKGNRDGKPLYFTEFREAFLAKYGRKVVQAVNCEAEDLLQHYASIELATKGDNFEDWTICGTYIDKDVDHVYMPSFNYDNIDRGWRYPTKLECELCLAAQTISGDPTDHITGLPSLTDSVKEQFSLNKRKGATKSTATELLEDSISIQDMWKRVIFCYQQYYGMDKVHKFKDVHGDTQEWVWLDFMQQCYVLVRMQEYSGQVPDVAKYLESIGVSVAEVSLEEPVVVDQTVLLEQLEHIGNDVTSLKVETKNYKSLAKPKLVEKLDKVKVLVDNLENGLKLIK